MASASSASNDFALRASKWEDFDEWYKQVITKGEMIRYYDVNGCYVLLPWAYAIWETIQKWLDIEIKNLGAKNAYFPIFVSPTAFKTKPEHFKDFGPEVAWVTKYHESEMPEPLALRPTSETVMYPIFSELVKSHRDLPIKLNQFCNVVRWESRQLIPFVITREILFQEGHSAFAHQSEAEEQVLAARNMYAQLYTDLLAIPVIAGRKTEKEKFAGGEYTTTVEIYLSGNGRVVQAATSHYLGQNFAKAFNIQFENPGTKNKQFVFQCSWGITSRAMGVAVMVHSDDKGLVLPPKVADIQVILFATSGADEEGYDAILKQLRLFENCLKMVGIRAEIDLDETMTPRSKCDHWGLKGVPIRMEVGLADLALQKFVAIRRDTGARIVIDAANLETSIGEILINIHSDLYQKAKQDLELHHVATEQWQEFCKKLESKFIIEVPFCGSRDCEDLIKQDTVSKWKTQVAAPGAPSMGAKSHCIPDFPLKGILKNHKSTQICIHPKCGKRAQYYTLFGRGY